MQLDEISVARVHGDVKRRTAHSKFETDDISVHQIEALATFNLWLLTVRITVISCGASGILGGSHSQRSSKCAPSMAG
jgi:hypothetical protein